MVYEGYLAISHIIGLTIFIVGSALFGIYVMVTSWLQKEERKRSFRALGKSNYWLNKHAITLTQEFRPCLALTKVEYRKQQYGIPIKNRTLIPFTVQPVLNKIHSGTPPKPAPVVCVASLPQIPTNLPDPELDERIMPLLEPAKRLHTTTDLNHDPLGGESQKTGQNTPNLKPKNSLEILNIKNIPRPNHKNLRNTPDDNHTETETPKTEIKNKTQNEIPKRAVQSSPNLKTDNEKPAATQSSHTHSSIRRDHSSVSCRRTPSKKVSLVERETGRLALGSLDAKLNAGASLAKVPISRATPFYSPPPFLGTPDNSEEFMASIDLSLTDSQRSIVPKPILTNKKHGVDYPLEICRGSCDELTTVGNVHVTEGRGYGKYEGGSVGGKVTQMEAGEMMPAGNGEEAIEYNEVLDVDDPTTVNAASTTAEDHRAQRRLFRRLCRSPALDDDRTNSRQLIAEALNTYANTYIAPHAELQPTISFKESVKRFEMLTRMRGSSPSRLLELPGVTARGDNVSGVNVAHGDQGDTIIELFNNRHKMQY